MKPFKNICVGVAISPTAPGLLLEAQQLAKLFAAEVTFVHICPENQDNNALLHELILHSGFEKDAYKLICKKGNVVDELLNITVEQNADLLILGALRHESQFQHLFGSLARKLARKSKSAVLLIPEPQEDPEPMEKIVVLIDEQSPKSLVETGISFCRRSANTKLFLAKESNFKDPQTTLTRYYSGQDIQRAQEKLLQSENEYIEQLLKFYEPIDFDYATKILFSHMGLGISDYVEHLGGDLLIVSYPKSRLSVLDRFFPHDVEHVLLHLPSKLLIIH